MARRWRKRPTAVSQSSHSQAVSDGASHHVPESGDASAHELPVETAGRMGRTVAFMSSKSRAINDEEASRPAPMSAGTISRKRQSTMAPSSQSGNVTEDVLRIARLAVASAQGSTHEIVGKKRRTASRSSQSQAVVHEAPIREAPLPNPEPIHASAHTNQRKAGRECRRNAPRSCRLQAIIDEDSIPVTGSSNVPAQALPVETCSGRCQTSASRSSQSQAMNVAESLPSPASTSAAAQGLLREIISRKSRTNASRSSQSQALNQEAYLPILDSTDAPARAVPVESLGREHQINESQSRQSQGVNGGASVPLPESTQASAQASQDDTHSSAARSTSVQKRVRGKTRNIELLLLPNGKKLQLEFNKHGQPIGPHASKFSSYLGNLVRNGGDAPISVLHWENVTEEMREKIYACLLEKFEFEETPLVKARIIQKMGKKFSDHKYHMKHDYFDKYGTTEERLTNVPEGVNKDDWAIFVSYHDKEEIKEICAKNKCNRAKQVIAHCTGSKSYAQIRAEEAQKDPEHREPSQMKMFRIAYTKRNGSVGSSAAKEILERFENLSNQMEDSSSSKGEDEIYRQIIGPERHGRVRGFGLGPTPSSVFGNGPSRTELMNQLREANKRNDELQSMVRELEKKIEDDRKKMEEEKKKAEEDRSKMDLLFSFMEEMRARPQ